MAQKPRRERRRISQVGASDVDVGSEPFGSDVPVESGMETAVIGEVTPAMMDEAAHRAAEAVEAAAHHVVIQAGHGDEGHGGEPVRHPVVEAATVTPIRSESHSPAAEPDPSDSLAVAVPPVESASMEASTHGEAVDETPAPKLPPVQAFEPPSPADGAAALSRLSRTTWRGPSTCPRLPPKHYWSVPARRGGGASRCQAKPSALMARKSSRCWPPTWPPPVSSLPL